MKYLPGSASAVLALCLQTLAPAPAVAAGPYTDELSKCLVRSTTDADKTLLVQWMFSTAALHPDVRWMANVDDGKRAEVNKKTAAMFQRLLTQACVAEAREAVKYEGASTLETGFNVLGQVAGRELFANPSVANGLAELDKYVDQPAIQKALGLTK